MTVQVVSAAKWVMAHWPRQLFAGICYPFLRTSIWWSATYRRWHLKWKSVQIWTIRIWISFSYFTGLSTKIKLLGCPKWMSRLFADVLGILFLGCARLKIFWISITNGDHWPHYWSVRSAHWATELMLPVKMQHLHWRSRGKLRNISPKECDWSTEWRWYGMSFKLANKTSIYEERGHDVRIFLSAALGV